MAQFPQKTHLEKNLPKKIGEKGKKSGMQLTELLAALNDVIAPDIINKYSLKSRLIVAEYSTMLEAWSETSPRRKQASLEVLCEEYSPFIKGESSYDGENTEFVAFIESLLELLFSSLDSGKICQKVKKLLLVSAESNPELVKLILSRYIEGILHSTDSPSLTAEKLCYILDELDLGRGCIDLEFERVMNFLASCLNQAARQVKADTGFTAVNSNKNLQHISVKMLIKILQHFPSNLSGMVFCQACNHQVDYERVNDDKGLCIHKVLENAISSVLEILFVKTDVSKELCQLCGLAFSLLLNVVAEKSSSVFHIIATLLHTEDTGEGFEMHKDNATERWNVLEVGCLRMTISAVSLSPISQIAVVQGLVRCGSAALLLSRGSVGDSGKYVCLVEGLLFDVLYQHCRHTSSPVEQYVAFQALKQWLQCVKQMLTDLLKSEQHHVVFHGASNPLTRKLLGLVWDSYEHPVEGVPDLVKAIFQLVLEVHHKEAAAGGVTENKFYEQQAQQVMNLPWHVKGRYSLLSCLTPFVDCQKLLEMNPWLPEELAKSLTSSQLASVTTDCYKAFLRQRGTNHIKAHTSSLNEVWMRVLVAALCSKERLQRLNAVHYWLPCTLKYVPDSYQFLLGQLERSMRHSEELSHSWCHLHAKLVTVRAARSLQVISTQHLEEHVVLLSEGIFHSRDDVRSAALGVISSYPRAVEGLSNLELKLLRQFLPHNMNIASPSFRQEMFGSLKRIVVRIRDSSLAVMKKCGLLEGNKENRKPFDKENLPVELKETMDFTGWLFDFAAKNLFPGACYQRQKSGVHLFSILLESMASKWSPDRRKGQTPEASQFLVSLARDYGFWDIFSPRNALVLCSCIESAHNDIREMARDLLEKHFPWPVIIVNQSSDTWCVAYLVQRTERMLCSPKAQETESGAALCHVIFTKYVLELGRNINLTWARDKASNQVGYVTGDMSTGPDEPGVDFLQQLVQELKRHATCARENLNDAASNTPVHGLLLALTRCLVVVLERVNSNDHGLSDGFLLSFRTLFKEVIAEANSIVQFMLDILSGGHGPNLSTVGGASFADMGEAIDELVMGSFSFEAKDPSSSKNQRELILSCCWLTIKGAYTLLGAAVENATFQQQAGCTRDDGKEDSGLISLKELEEIGQSFLAALIHCRHRGIVEGCKPSFIRICKRLMSLQQSSVRELPRQWLETVLTAITSDSAAASVTRRSAGLPLLVACVLCCEPHSVPGRPLLSHCIWILFKVASEPLPKATDQTSDLSQAHGMNILKMLYQDTSLGTHTLQYAGNGLILAISGFASPSWAIRNAATQLFGSVVARMFGEKIGSDAEEECRTISVRELFNHYPRLEGFFLQQLQVDLKQAQSTNLGQEGQLAGIRGGLLKPELFPVLTVLSKLRPSASNRKEGFRLNFIPLLMVQASSSVFSVRVVAARALVPFITIGQLLEKAVELLRSLPASSQQLFSQNFLHGTLCQVKALLIAAHCYNSKGNTERLEEALRERVWVATHLNPCPLTRAQLLDIMIEYAPSLICGQGMASSLQSEVTTFVAAGCTVVHHPLPPQSYTCQVGGALLNRALSRACFSMTKEGNWLQGEEIKGDGPGVISSLLSSPDYECRLVALNGIKSLHSPEQCALVMEQRLFRHLVDMVHIETDHSCMLALLSILTEMDNCLLSSTLTLEDTCRLWTRLVSLVRGECGIPVAASALPPCSKVLSYYLQLTEQDGDCEWVCEMLQEWRLMVQIQSQPQKDEQQRSAAVKALRIVGVLVLRMAVDYQSKDSHIGYSLEKTAFSVFLAAKQLLEDEDEDVRTGAAEFGSQVPRVSPVSVVSETMNCSSSMTALLEYVTNAFWWRPGLWVAMETLIRGPANISVAMDEYINARCLLYEQEDANLYAEPLTVARVGGRVFKMVVSRVFSAENQNTILEDFWEWLIATYQQLTSDMEQIVKSGLRDLGSFQSPKPFTLLFRLFYWATVLMHAYTVATSSCHDQTRELTERNRDMQHVITQVLYQLEQEITVCHPLLHEVIQEASTSNKSNSPAQTATEDMREQFQAVDLSSGKTNG